MSDEARSNVLKSRKTARPRILVVSNGGAVSSDSSEDESILPPDEYNSYQPPAHATSSNISFDERRPLPRHPPPLTTDLYEHRHYPSSRSNPSNPALSSPSSTSSPAIESTPPPSTPGQSNPPTESSSEGTLRQEPAIVSYPDSNDSAYQLTTTRNGFIDRLRSRLPPRHSHGRRPSGTRPPTSPTSANDSYSSQTSANRASPSERSITLLVTTDAEHLVIVELTGARNPAFIRERIYAKLHIADEDQPRYSIYRTEIGKFAIGEALSDEQLWELYCERGDERGSIMLLVSFSHATVHEPPFVDTKEHSPVNTIVPPVLPQMSQMSQTYNRRRRSNSRRGSISSTSERREVAAGYDASVSDDLDHGEREPRRARRSPPQPPYPRQPLPPRPKSPSGFGRPQSPGGIISPDRMRLPPPPPPPSGPPPRPERVRGSAPPTALVQTQSPELTRGQDGIPFSSSSPWHMRAGSDAASERDRMIQTPDSQPEATSPWRSPRDRDDREKDDRDRLRRRDCIKKETSGLKRSKQVYHETSERRPEEWTFVSSGVPSSGYRRDRPTTPQDSRSSPRGLSSYGLNIPHPPRGPPPAPPGGAETRDRNKRQQGKPVPGGYVIAYKGPQNPGKGEPTPVPQSPPGAAWGPRLGAKSMNNLNDAYKAQAQAPLVGIPGRRAPASPLPVSSKPTAVPGLPYANTESAASGYHDQALDVGLPKSYDGSRGSMNSPTSYHSSRVQGVSTYMGTSVSAYLGIVPPSSTQEPLKRPPSSLGGDPTTSPYRSNRPLQSPNGPDHISPEASQTRAAGPSHYPSSSAPGLPYRDETHPTSFGPRPLPAHPGHGRTATESLPIFDRSPLSRVPRTPPRSPINSKTPPSGTMESERRLPEVPNRTLSSLPVQEDDLPSSAENTMRPDNAVHIIGMLEKNIGSEMGTVGPLRPQPPSAGPRQPSPAPAPDIGSFNLNEEGTYMSSRTMSSDDSDRESGTGTYWAKPPQKPPRPVLTPIDTDSPPSVGCGIQLRDTSRAPPAGFPGPPGYIPDPPPLRRVNPRRAQDQRMSRFDNNFDNTWAPRPPPEEVFERLQEYFPEHDVDEPVIEAVSGGTSPTSAEPDPPPQADRRFRHKKSIRVVAAEHKRRTDRTSRMEASANNGGLRKRNTKLWGSRLEEVTTDHVHGHHETQATTTEASPGPAKPIFRWVRGELIGKGTFGKVYLALNATTGEMIAVKQVEMPRTASDKDDSRQITVVEALKLESETLKDLDHPNIVQYLGFEETPTFLSIFLEYVPGGSIASCLRKHGKFDEEVTKSFTGQILSGLEYLHSKGILHRDLKADNILVETTGICKISDFGISKRTDDINMEAFTSMQGTVFWMAPEVIDANKKGYNSKIDIWSVGCVVFEMWTGQRPWSGKEAMAVLLELYRTKQGPPVPPGVMLAPLADDFRKKCFATNPDDRPTAAELRRHPYLELQPDWTFNGFK